MRVSKWPDALHACVKMKREVGPNIEIMLDVCVCVCVRTGLSVSVSVCVLRVCVRGRGSVCWLF